MEPHNRAKDATFYPARLQFGITTPQHVAAISWLHQPYPIFEAVAVNSGWKFKESHVMDGIAGEPQRVALRTRTAVARKSESSPMAVRTIEIVVVIQYPQRIKATC